MNPFDEESDIHLYTGPVQIQVAKGLYDNICDVLRAIAEGHDVRVYNERYITVENPEYHPAKGNNPNLVIDIEDLMRPYR